MSSSAVCACQHLLYARSSGRLTRPKQQRNDANDSHPLLKDPRRHAVPLVLAQLLCLRLSLVPPRTLHRQERFDLIEAEPVRNLESGQLLLLADFDLPLCDLEFA